MRLHRWVALVLGTWFALLGLTGTVLVWHGELDRALNPQWFAPRAACADVERPVVGALAVLARDGDGAVATQVMAPAVPGAAHVVWSKTADGARLQHFVDVGCDAYLGRREWGALRMDRAHAVPALYELHRSLLSGEVGHALVGLAGLALLFVAVSGAMTAWPRHATREAWKRALTVKRGAAPRRRYYDLHRAGGLWLLAFLLLMAVSGAYLCFPKQGRAVVAAVLPSPSSQSQSSRGAPTNSQRPCGHVDGQFSPDALVTCAEQLWPSATWSRVGLPARDGDPFEVRLLQAGEPRMDTGDTRVRVHADGRIAEVRDPLNAPAGDTLIAWLFPLHSGEALGMAGRMLWTLFGLLPGLLFATGAWLWWQRRQARSRRPAH
ncbi:PepSY-associated TM helix domain-containing protein [Aerolutibacter ruishenii]|uniref:Putative iron-regulated membrane protein n=1 Tax=Aerolutibacter ruishenii TaxID=686800 RepID=A0A562LGU3_9GAMM|nr:PepSY-associated TM helix domain-containing protein [Lysobacter ruishenii]TWI06840.1 putative iron-regulated membrane protein [Lysobacter ruishenii]